MVCGTVYIVDLRHEPLSCSVPQRAESRAPDIDIVQILLNKPRTEVGLKRKSGRSALSFIVGSGHLEIIKALLERGAFRANDQDNTCWTPLFWAV
jgi:ankyrin repeat protein